MIYVKISFPTSILSIYRPGFFKLCIGACIVKEFHQISTELWPLIYVKISFPASVLCTYLPIVFKLCINVYVRK